jgi:hypothetical protein
VVVHGAQRGHVGGHALAECLGLLAEELLDAGQCLGGRAEVVEVPVGNGLSEEAHVLLLVGFERLPALGRQGQHPGAGVAGVVASLDQSVLLEWHQGARDHGGADRQGGGEVPGAGVAAGEGLEHGVRRAAGPEGLGPAVADGP